MPPKAALKAEPLQRYLYGLARELGMTYTRLLRELGDGELAYQLAYDELESEKRMRATERANRAAAAMRRR